MFLGLLQMSKQSPQLGPPAEGGSLGRKHASASDDQVQECLTAPGHLPTALLSGLPLHVLRGWVQLTGRSSPLQWGVLLDRRACGPSEASLNIPLTLTPT